MSTQFITDVLTIEVALIKPFAKEILQMFDESPDSNTITMEADTYIQDHDTVQRQMWLLRQLLVGSYIMMTSYELKKKNGKFSVKLNACKVPQNSEENHAKLIADIHDQAEKALLE